MRISIGVYEEKHYAYYIVICKTMLARGNIIILRIVSRLDCL